MPPELAGMGGVGEQ
jgi:hypothetical protein